MHWNCSYFTWYIYLLIALAYKDPAQAKRAEQRRECAETTDQHQFPWWRLKYDSFMYIDNVIVRLGSRSNLEKHFLAVRIGMEDISKMGQDKAFDKNHQCIQKTTDAATIKMTFVCKMQVGIKFLSIQMIPNCSLTNNCTDGEEHVLQLCEVGITGIPLDLTGHKIQPSTVNEKSGLENAKQSSVAYKSRPENATSTNETTKIGLTLCGVDGFINEIDDKWVQTSEFGNVFDSTYLIDKLEVDILKPNIRIVDRKITAYAGMTLWTQKTNEQCAQWIDNKRSDSTIKFKCNPPVKGLLALIMINSTKTSHTEGEWIREIDNCDHDLRVWGYKIINLAFHKPTKHSSENCQQHQFCSDRLVDGNLEGSLKHSFDFSCRLLSETSKNPWWRVDLLKYHIVKAVSIFGNKTDLEIRVGNVDISQTTDKANLEKNILCKKITKEHIMSVGKDTHSLGLDISNFIKCNTPLFGRYVSIQQTKPAEYLQICEVEVYGIPVSITNYGISDQFARNAVSDITEFISSEETDESDYHSWSQKFKNEVAIDAVEIYFEDTFVESNTTSSLNLSIYIDSNQCFHDVIKITSSFVSVSCKFALGQVILLLYKWSPTSDKDPISIVYANIAEFNVDYSKLNFTLQPFNPKQGDRIRGVIQDSSISVKNNKQIQGQRFRYLDNSCSYTFPGDPYPWWRVQFKKIFKVVSFEVKTENNGDGYEKLHDIEVRVGFHDIANSSSATPLTTNELCYDTGNSQLLPTSQPIKCSNKAIGLFFSIQMVKSCSNPSICSMIIPNVLKLCYVELKVIALENFKDSGSKIKPTVETAQSSSMPDRRAQLALPNGYVIINNA